jgi:hypothetical protein
VTAPELVDEQAAEQHLRRRPEREPRAEAAQQQRRAPVRGARRVRREACSAGREEDALGDGRVGEAARCAAAHRGGRAGARRAAGGAASGARLPTRGAG